jgi:hypothetical protein
MLNEKFWRIVHSWSRMKRETIIVVRPYVHLNKYRCDIFQAPFICAAHHTHWSFQTMARSSATKGTIGSCRKRSKVSKDDQHPKRNDDVVVDNDDQAVSANTKSKGLSDVIMHVVHGVNTYRDVSVASSIFGGMATGFVPEEFVNAVVGCSHNRVISGVGNSPGPVRTTAQNVPRTSGKRRGRRKRGEPIQIIWDDTKSENGNFYQCGYCNRDELDGCVQPDIGDWTLVKTRYRRRRRRNLNVKRGKSGPRR